MMIEQIQGINNFIPNTDSVDMQSYSLRSVGEEDDNYSISFSSLLQDMAGRAIGDIEKAEDASLSALQGQTSMREAVDCIMQAERTLNMSIALRDKIVSAVLEVSKMQI
ncbi:flagellar hook-basal body complex protein FliE [Candidatus Liberibacter brunswickensis]|uniref:flagellar hook-basal body complex protein FliE n=1 Tax=Candidatus Liberibacter brunswickensis TaxID=1968796 RepID=UPI0038CC04A3